MNNMLSAWERQFTRPQMTVEERRQRGFLALFLGLLTPALIIIGLLNGLSGNPSSVDAGIWLGAAMGALSLLALRYLNKITAIFHLGFIFTLTILTYEVAVGNGEGAAFLWFYFYPLATFFMFGKRVGLIWVAASWAILVALLVFNWGPYPYAAEIGIRVVVTYTLVCILGYGLESSRSHYYEQLLSEKLALEAALHQVKTLQGMLPICASCKKIRDDTGYWHQVETYISQHAAVEFSHSICPECRTRLYPGRTS
jgi:hypothetical protein